MATHKNATIVIVLVLHEILDAIGVADRWI